MQQDHTQALTGLEIAIVGMAGRFPGAESVAELWHHLQAGREGITRFTDDELAAAGVPAAARAHPAYVKARGSLEGADRFDAAFFGISPREAEVMDPQHRLFLETAWQAVEDAGYAPGAYGGSIGVYAGASLNNHVVRVWSDRDLMAAVGSYQAVLNNDKDFLATRAAYKLGLRGPALTVQTACSTSLVAVHLACRALLGGECAMALAGGVAVSDEETAGYVYQEGGIRSPDGHCRTFDARSGGTVGGSGVALVVLKRLDDALAGGDTIHAVIKGSAINNDGDAKVGYTAPAEDGQVRAIRDALDFAEVTADTVGYVEAHGTATSLGDPIEVAALTRAYRADGDGTGWCALGSVKSAIGHLDAAAGVTGLIKAAAAVRDGVIPPMVHFTSPNPALQLESTPFYVPADAREWKTGGMPRRAGVSSFGIGGTNAHAVLEQAPAAAAEPGGPARELQLLVVSARTADALGTARANLAAHLRARPEQPLADVAHTLRMGRAPFRHRAAIVCATRDEAVAALQGDAGSSARTGEAIGGEVMTAFLFPGQGSQHVGMGRELYEAEPVFRTEVDRCAAILLPTLGFDLRDVLYPTSDVEAATARLTRTAVAQPALFTLSWATAKLWMARGITPDAMLGHSIGEYAAACLAGVFPLEDALALVAERGRLMDALPSGAMMAVSLPEEAVLPLLGAELSLAAVNGPAACVASGPEAAIEALRMELEARGEACRQLHTSHAFHSAMMDPALEAFTAAVRRAAPRAPELPFISNLTGTWITAAQATDPGYWAAHLRGTVRFAAGVAELLGEPGRVLLEVGPGRALSTLARRIPEAKDRVVIASLPAAGEEASDARAFLEATGALWTAGARPDWQALVEGESRRRVPLPTYPFERRIFRLERKAVAAPGRPKRRVKGVTADVADWFYRPVWTSSEAPAALPAEDRPKGWLVFADDSGLADRVAARLRDGGAAVDVARAGDALGGGEGEWTIDPARPADYDALLRLLAAEGRRPEAIVHLGAASGEVPEVDAVSFDAEQARGWFPLLHTAQALARHAAGVPMRLFAVTAGACPVAEEETVVPARATVPALLRVIAQEYPDLACRAVDFAAGPAGARALDRRAEQLVTEMMGRSPEPVAAWRGRARYVQEWDEVRMDAPAASPLREGGVYLITGGMGGLGFVLAEHLAQIQAKVVLIGRTPLPPREEWDAFLATAPERSRTAARIRRVRRLEALGAEVLVAHADASDAMQLRRIASVAQRRWGAVHGVFHAAAAGAAEGQAHTAIPQTGREQAAWHHRPKAHAAMALEKALRGVEVDFVVLYSSLSAVLGGLRFAAYASSNAWLDAFAHHAERAGAFPWISIGWDGWRNDPADGGERETGIAPAQGMDALERILSRPAQPQMAVCTGSLHERLDRWVRRAADPAGADEAESNGADASADPRRHLSTPYVAPQDELQERIAAVWSELLGAPSVGIDDDFLELGGHSLLGIQVLSRLRRELQVDLSVDALFRAPTVAELAAVVEAAFLAELAELSEEEALSLVDG